MVRSDIEALGHYGLTVAFLFDQNPHELVMVVVESLTLLMEGCCYFIVVMLSTMVVIKCESPNLHKIMQFPALSFN